MSQWSECNFIKIERHGNKQAKPGVDRGGLDRGVKGRTWNIGVSFRSCRTESECLPYKGVEMFVVVGCVAL